MKIKDIALLVLVIIIIFFSFKDNPNNTAEIITKTDTIRVETIRFDTIRVDNPIYIYRSVTLPNPQIIATDRDTINNYIDTLNYVGLQIHYNLFVKGELKKFDIGYLDTRPQIIKTISQTNTITNEIKKYRNGFYLGGEIGGSATTFNFSPKITLHRNKWLYSYRYGLTDKSHSISVQHKIF